MEKVINNQNNEQQKPIFYVFSGIEQTLIGKDFIKSYYRGLREVYGELRLDSYCIDALNYLLKNLDEKFDARLVVTAKRREYPESCEHYLKMNGLEYDKPLLFTKYFAGPRGEKVVDFLDSQNAGPLTYHTAPFYVRFLKNLKDNPDFKNYVVLDGNRNHLSKYIPSQQLMVVSKRTGLTFDDADQILFQNGIEPKQQPESENQFQHINA